MAQSLTMADVLRIPAAEPFAAGAHWLSIFFRPTKSLISDVRVLGRSHISSVAPRGGHALFKLTEADARRGVSISVEYRGEPVSIWFTRWTGEDALPRLDLDFNEEYFKQRRADLAELEQQLSQLDDLGSAQAVELRKLIRANSYFLNLDEQTAVHVPGTSEEVLDEIDVLRSRLDRRWAVYGTSQGLADPDELPSPCDLSGLSRLQADIMRATFRPPGSDVFDPSLVRDAFERFARGSLGACSAPSARPDSAYVFLFAEFATAAIHADQDSDVWVPIFPWLVEMQAWYSTSFGFRTGAEDDETDACAAHSIAPSLRFEEYGPARSNVELAESAVSEIREFSELPVPDLEASFEHKLHDPDGPVATT